ncbi:NADP-dependent phosphogluconate dehydrogenase [Cognatishimia activa]|uniref:6-phosphogluconate dehydrogenase, decarboxylating n=1 Tax=Cognatishimia activa TaxID=1715691 RepID=A0A0P1ISB9_9RHOB|nr:NADP-dependent phosphogluconate dehydrogenase [Cognatishimia activa]CUI62287.1 6-phosphogluconate dehydrogenase, NADP(+)-dependent, decarboxylating [Cognatishimia activa]CUK26326.1 6-phosphogluconate dehydrogenase, NADP(+)-dependent, decarboxylating [Cognatishimia activa]
MTTASMGLIGVGTMGSALALNIAENGHDIALYNLDPSTIDALIENAGELAPRLTKTESVEELVKAMPSPRAIILLVPAGAPVEASINALIPLLESGDTIIDGGNSDFRETQERTKRVEAAGINYLGVGVSGGAEGARHGPSMMVGGSPSAWEPIRPVLEAISAKHNGEPCVAHFGPDGAGHFVKTVHNGIEYADMQLIAEIYGLLRDGEGRKPSEIAPMFARWNEGILKSYLTEISAKVLEAVDPDTGQPVVDVIVDKAGQKGTGRWTVIEAIRMGQSASIIEAAVGARVMSSERETRAVAAGILGDGPNNSVTFDEDDLEAAFLAARILSYAQGFRILKAASDEFEWDLDYAKIAEVWREGCIIRSALLDDIATAFRGNLPDGRLILSDHFAPLLLSKMDQLRKVVSQAVLAGLPVAALSSAISWFDEVRQSRGTADMIQGQRDFFGAHSFLRLDKEGSHHGPWHADRG